MFAFWPLPSLARTCKSRLCIKFILSNCNCIHFHGQAVICHVVAIATLVEHIAVVVTHALARSVQLQNCLILPLKSLTQVVFTLEISHRSPHSFACMH